MPCRAVDAVLPAQFLRPHSGLVLLQDANDLLFAETAFPHRLSPRLENRLTSNCGLFRGACHDPYITFRRGERSMHAFRILYGDRRERVFDAQPNFMEPLEEVGNCSAD